MSDQPETTAEALARVDAALERLRRRAELAEAAINRLLEIQLDFQLETVRNMRRIISTHG